MEEIQRPAYLKKGDSIGIIAPARWVTEDELHPFIAYIQASGFNISYGKNFLGKNHQFSGTVEERLADLHEMFRNPEIKAVFAARGGYGSAQLLAGMDWELIRNNPKWFIGFSDVSALHAAFQKFMESIHGVMPFSMMMEKAQDIKSFNLLLRFLKGEKLQYELNDHPLNVEGSFRGQLTGGNLSVLYSLSGTPYEGDYSGKILFLEDLDEYLYHLDRMMLNLELRGVFTEIGGMLVGDFSALKDNPVPFGKSAYEIIAERAVKYDIPTLFGFPSGHDFYNHPLIFGRLSTLTVKKGSSSLSMY